MVGTFRLEGGFRPCARTLDCPDPWGPKRRRLGLPACHPAPTADEGSAGAAEITSIVRFRTGERRAIRAAVSPAAGPGRGRPGGARPAGPLPRVARPEDLYEPDPA